MEKPSRRPTRRAASEGWQKSFQEASPYLGLGMQLALTMVFFVGGGYLLDRWLDTAPWLLLAGAILGMVGVFINLFFLVRKLSQEGKKADKTRAPVEPPEDPPASDG